MAVRRQPKNVAISRGARRACEGLGATYVKFAQLVASAPAVVGPTVADEFRGTLDRGPGVPMCEARRLVEQTTGKRIERAVCESSSGAPSRPPPWRSSIARR